MMFFKIFKKKKKELSPLETKELKFPDNPTVEQVADYISACKLMLQHLENDVDEFEKTRKNGTFISVELHSDFWLKDGITYDSVKLENFNQKEMEEISDFVMKHLKKKIEEINNLKDSYQIVKKEK